MNLSKSEQTKNQQSDKKKKIEVQENSANSKVLNEEKSHNYTKYISKRTASQIKLEALNQSEKKSKQDESKSYISTPVKEKPEKAKNEEEKFSITLKRTPSQLAANNKNTLKYQTAGSVKTNPLESSKKKTISSNLATPIKTPPSKKPLQTTPLSARSNHSTTITKSQTKSNTKQDDEIRRLPSRKSTTPTKTPAKNIKDTNLLVSNKECQEISKEDELSKAKADKHLKSKLAK